MTSVTIDTYCHVGFGVLGRFANLGYQQNVTINGAAFQNVSAGATFMIAGYDVNGDTNNPSTTNTGQISLIWDNGGGNQIMTPLGNPVYNPNQGDSIQLFGLVNPNSGNKSMGIQNTNNTVGNQNGVYWSISFFGTDPAGTVSSVTTGYASAKDSGSTSNPATVTSSAIIPIGGMAVSQLMDDSVPLQGWPSDGGTVGDSISGGISYFETYTGAGSPITASGVGSPAGFWNAAIVGLLPVGGGGGGSTQQFIALKRRRFMQFGLAALISKNGILRRDNKLILPQPTWKKAA